MKILGKLRKMNENGKIYNEKKIQHKSILHEKCNNVLKIFTKQSEKLGKFVKMENFIVKRHPSYQKRIKKNAMKSILYRKCKNVLKILTKMLGKTRKICENGKLYHNLILNVIIHQKSMKKVKKRFRLWWDLIS